MCCFYTTIDLMIISAGSRGSGLLYHVLGKKWFVAGVIAIPYRKRYHFLLPTSLDTFTALRRSTISDILTFCRLLFHNGLAVKTTNTLYTRFLLSQHTEKYTHTYTHSRLSQCAFLLLFHCLIK